MGAQSRWQGTWWWCRVRRRHGKDLVEVEFMEPPHFGYKCHVLAASLRWSHQHYVASQEQAETALVPRTWRPPARRSAAMATHDAVGEAPTALDRWKKATAGPHESVE